jgi:hypothetical protein
MISTRAVVTRWARDGLSILQAIGQILQHLVRQEKEIEDLRQQVARLAQRVRQPGGTGGRVEGAGAMRIGGNVV